jgi:hypothetical protein
VFLSLTVFVTNNKEYSLSSQHLSLAVTPHVSENRIGTPKAAAAAPAHLPFTGNYALTGYCTVIAPLTGHPKPIGYLLLN